MIFDIVTIFPEIFNSYLRESLIARAQKKGLIKIKVHNLRKWAKDRHQTVDDRPFGGGLGMVLKVEPIYRCVQRLKRYNGRNARHIEHLARSSRSSRLKRFERLKRLKQKVILFTPRGRKFNQRIAYQLSKLDQLILICGRYEGVDERVAKHIADLELSIGDYDLMGGELPAMIVIETVARLIPGILGKPQLLKERITKEKGFIEYPQYTRPEVFSAPPSSRLRPSADKVALGRRSRRPGKKGIKWRVPKLLLSGNHQKIAEWRKKHGKAIASRR